MKPNVGEMIKLMDQPEAFMLKVSELTTPTPCPVAPKIADPPEVVAERMIKAERLGDLDWAAQALWSMRRPRMRMSFWIAYRSSPFEKILCGLIAMGKVDL